MCLSETVKNGIDARHPGKGIAKTYFLMVRYTCLYTHKSTYPLLMWTDAYTENNVNFYNVP